MGVRARVVALVAAVGAVVGFAAPAHAVTDTWTIESAPVPTSPNANLQSVSCPDASTCVAVGSYLATNARSRPFADIGTPSTLRASYPVLPDPLATSTQLTGVSCVSATFCLAVGWYQRYAKLRSLVELWNGARWSLQTDALTGDALSSVACASTSFCVALANSGGSAELEAWNGQAWSAVYTAAGLDITDLACRSASSCLGIGSQYDETSGHAVPVAVVWDGAGWSTQLSADPAPKQDVSLQGVSCVVSGCTAVGAIAYGRSTLVETWDGSTWSIVGSPTPSGGARLMRVSCATTSSCLAVGTSSGKLMIEAWNGSAWKLQPGPNPSPAPGENEPVLGLDCHAGSACVLVTTDSGLPYVAVRANGAWTLSSAGNGSGASEASLEDVSCAGGSCAAVGYVDGTAGGLLVEWYDGTAWRPTVLPVPGSGDNAALFTVSCASASFCVALGSSSRDDMVGISETWNGQNWQEQSLPATAGRSRGLGQISCPAVNNCYAAGDLTDLTTFASQPEILHFDGQQWSESSVPAGTGDSFLQRISCPSANFCAVTGISNGTTGQSAFVAVSNAGTWTVTPLSSESSVSAISCASDTRCFAVGSRLGRNGLGLIEAYDGSGWSTQIVDTGRGSSYSAVACASDADCLLIGTVMRQSNAVPIAAHWNGATWASTAAPVTPQASRIGLESLATRGSGYVAAGNLILDTSQPLIESYS